MAQEARSQENTARVVALRADRLGRATTTREAGGVKKALESEREVAKKLSRKKYAASRKNRALVEARVNGHSRPHVPRASVNSVPAGPSQRHSAADFLTTPVPKNRSAS